MQVQVQMQIPIQIPIPIPIPILMQVQMRVQMQMVQMEALHEATGHLEHYVAHLGPFHQSPAWLGLAIRHFVVALPDQVDHPVLLNLALLLAPQLLADHSCLEQLSVRPGRHLLSLQPVRVVLVLPSQ